MEKMSAALAIDARKYARLLTRTLPVPIETEKEYERRLTEAKHLMEKGEEALTAEEGKLLGLLVTLIEQYEEHHYPIDPVSPQVMLQHLMEARGLTHKDVWALFGSKGVASEVLNGKRAVSKAQAKKLAEFFHVSPALFI
jgi:HTH-type transcriptional regulator / antitoxin HigA